MSSDNFCKKCLSANPKARLQPIATQHNQNPPRIECDDPWHDPKPVEAQRGGNSE